MTPDLTPNDPRALWQSQRAPKLQMSPGELRDHVSRAHRKLRRKTLALYVFGALNAAAVIVVAIVVSDPIMRIGALLMVVTFAYVVLQVRLHLQPAEVSAASPVAPADPSIEFYRMDLKRYRDFYRGIGLWSRLALGIPAGCVFFYGFAGAYPELAPVIRAEFAAFVLFVVVIGIPVQLRRSRRYQERIDELDAA